MKSPTHLERCIVCPKCGTKTMRKALGKNPVAEYFDDKCHSYFTIEELVNEWGYDYGDFYGSDNGGVDTELTTPERNRATLLIIERYERNNPRPFSEKSSELDLGETDEDWDNVVSHRNDDKIIATTWFDTVSLSSLVIDEPTFKSPSERLEAYEMVDRMFIGIPEWGMENNEVDTGALHA